MPSASRVSDSAPSAPTTKRALVVPLSVASSQPPCVVVTLERAHPVLLDDSAGRFGRLEEHRFHLGVVEQPGLANLRADREGPGRVHELEAMPPGRASGLEEVENAQLPQHLDGGCVEDVATIRITREVAALEQPHRAPLPGEREGCRRPGQTSADHRDIAFVVVHSRSFLGPSWRAPHFNRVTRLQRRNQR